MSPNDVTGYDLLIILAMLLLALSPLFLSQGKERNPKN